MATQRNGRLVRLLPHTLLFLVLVCLCSSSSLGYRDDSSSGLFSSSSGYVSHSLMGDDAVTPSVELPLTNVPHLYESSVPAFLIIDVQKCFLPGGPIPVPKGDHIIPIINSIRQGYFFRSIVRPQFLVPLARFLPPFASSSPAFFERY